MLDILEDYLVAVVLQMVLDGKPVQLVVVRRAGLAVWLHAFAFLEIIVSLRAFDFPEVIVSVDGAIAPSTGLEVYYIH